MEADILTSRCLVVAVEKWAFGLGQRRHFQDEYDGGYFSFFQLHQLSLSFIREHIFFLGLGIEQSLSWINPASIRTLCSGGNTPYAMPTLQQTSPG